MKKNKTQNIGPWGQPWLQPSDAPRSTQAIQLFTDGLEQQICSVIPLSLTLSGFQNTRSTHAGPPADDHGGCGSQRGPGGDGHRAPQEAPPPWAHAHYEVCIHPDPPLTQAMVALASAMAPPGLFFLSVILFPVLPHWMLAMALSGVFSWALFCV